ncbi:MAG: HDOD domain-containing protein, partial [Desulfobacula sp.]
MAYQKIEHIASGRFRTGKAGAEIFQAYLATCLGVALYDATTKTGGLIHILLPEPPGFSETEYPEKYASTGIPLLIGELINLGANPEHIRAVIAGGALVGPVSRQDVDLDIGGRSAEIAASILKSAGIRTIKSETGGFFTCTLELHMATGETSIHPAWMDICKSENTFAAPTMENISETIDTLKPIPQAALKILRMFHSSSCHINDITRELTKDQVLSGQTLKLCNSALFSGLLKIDSLKDAVMLLGEDMLIKSIITAAVQNYYNQTGTSGYSLCKGGLFFHAVGVAVLSEKIAEKTGQCPPKQAYTAGLLHDIGKVVLDQYIAGSAPLFFRKLGNDTETLISSEKKIFGITHSETGAVLAKKWYFSDNLSEAIRFHHNPEQAKENKPLAFIIYLA